MLQTWEATPAAIAGVKRSLVNPGEVVVHEVERDGGDVVLQLLRKSVGQPRDRRMDIRMVRFCRST